LGEISTAHRQRLHLWRIPHICAQSVSKVKGFGLRVSKVKGFGLRVSKVKGFGLRVSKVKGFGLRVGKVKGFGLRVGKVKGFGLRPLPPCLQRRPLQVSSQDNDVAYGCG
jgi:hypothetical protein